MLRRADNSWQVLVSGECTPSRSEPCSFLGTVVEIRALGTARARPARNGVGTSDREVMTLAPVQTKPKGAPRQPFPEPHPDWKSCVHHPGVRRSRRTAIKGGPPVPVSLKMRYSQPSGKFTKASRQNPCLVYTDSRGASGLRPAPALLARRNAEKGSRGRGLSAHSCPYCVGPTQPATWLTRTLPRYLRNWWK